MPIELQGDSLVIGISNPAQEIPEKEIASLAKVAMIRRVLCTPEAVNLSIETHYGDPKIGA
jgi:hypothetical protein